MPSVGDQVRTEFAHAERRLEALRSAIMDDLQHAFDALRLDVRAALQETRGALTAQLDDLEATLCKEIAALESAR